MMYPYLVVFAVFTIRVIYIKVTLVFKYIYKYFKIYRIKIQSNFEIIIIQYYIKIIAHHYSFVIITKCYFEI